jgi:hypothetical protein
MGIHISNLPAPVEDLKFSPYRSKSGASTASYFEMTISTPLMSKAKEGDDRDPVGHADNRGVTGVSGSEKRASG